MIPFVSQVNDEKLTANEASKTALSDGQYTTSLSIAAFACVKNTSYLW